MKKLTALLLLVSLFSCQHEPDDVIDPTLQVDDRPTKMVQVDADDDSVVLKLTWNASGQVEKINFNIYVDGIVGLTGNQLQTYLSNGNLSSVRGTATLTGTNQTQNFVQTFLQNENKVVGARYPDPSSPGDMLYDKYEYDSKGHLMIIVESLDSVTYFTANKKEYYFYDSLVYDAQNRLTEHYEVAIDPVSGQNTISKTEKWKNFDNNPVFIPGGVTAYLLIGDLMLLGSNNPQRIDYVDESGGPFGSQATGAIIYTNTYDAKNRPVKLAFTDSDNAGNSDHGSKLIYY